MVGQIRAGRGCGGGETVKNTLKGGGTEKRKQRFLKWGGGGWGVGGKLCQGVGILKRRAGTPLQTMTL